MKSHWFTTLCLFLLPFASIDGFTDGLEYKKGETWTYEVNGSRPWFPGDVNGDRVIEIVKVNETGYEAEEEWGYSENGPVVLSINKKGLQTKLEAGQFVIEYSSPIPFQYVDLLEVEKEKDFGKYVNDNGQFSMSMATTVKREKDEDVKVPAGEFKGCQHYIVTIVFAIEGNQGSNSSEMIRHIWAHSKVNGIVKDKYEYESLAPDAGGEKVKGEALLKKHEVVNK